MFVKGQSGNPKGRPKGSVGGRMAALAALDRMMGRRRNIADLEAALQREFDRDPAAFMRTYVMPLVPKEAKLNLDAKTVVEWKTLATSPKTDLSMHRTQSCPMRVRIEARRPSIRKRGIRHADAP